MFTDFVIYANYLRRKYNGQRYFALLIPAIGYAFMSYTMVYSLSIMWLDGVIFLPLVLLGAEKYWMGNVVSVSLFAMHFCV